MTQSNFDALFAKLPDRELLRVDEVAVFMGVTRKTIYSWYPEILKGTNVNGIIRIYRQSVIDVVINNDGKKKSDENSADVEQKVKSATKKPVGRRSGWVTDF